jgi:hypothetical protein
MAGIMAAEDCQQPGEIAGVAGHAAFGADQARRAGYGRKLPRWSQRIAYQSRVQPGGLARGLRQIPGMDQDFHRVPLQEPAQRHLPAPWQRHRPGQRSGVQCRHQVSPCRAPRGQQIVSGSESRASRSICLAAPGRERLDRPQVTEHVTGDIGGAPARARRGRIPAARRNPGEHGLKTVERANEAIQNHVSQYLSGNLALRAVRYRGTCEHA